MDFFYALFMAPVWVVEWIISWPGWLKWPAFGLAIGYAIGSFVRWVRGLDQKETDEVVELWERFKRNESGGA